jgi:hypothetical protein
VVAGLNTGILAGRRGREFQTRKIEEGKGRLTLGDPESVNRSFEDCLNRPLRIVIENCFVSIVLNDHVPSLTQELHIRGYGRNAPRGRTDQQRRSTGEREHHHRSEETLSQILSNFLDSQNSRSLVKAPGSC